MHAAGAQQADSPPTHTQQPEPGRHSEPVRCTNPREGNAVEPFPFGKGSFFGKGGVAPSASRSLIPHQLQSHREIRISFIYSLFLHHLVSSDFLGHF